MENGSVVQYVTVVDVNGSEVSGVEFQFHYVTVVQWTQLFRAPWLPSAVFSNGGFRIFHFQLEQHGDMLSSRKQKQC